MKTINEDRLSDLVGYILLCRKQGTKATRQGFIETNWDTPPTKRLSQLFRWAIEQQFIRETGEFIGRQPVLDIGKRWEEVPISHAYNVLL